MCVFGMHKSRRFVTICRPNVTFFAMSILVSIHSIFLSYFCLLIFCLPNKLYIILYYKYTILYYTIYKNIGKHISIIVY